MFTYGYRILDRYQLPLVSTAILTDDNKSWRPNFYETSFFGSRFRADFVVVKLLDYKNKIEELEKSHNPFASVILVQLAAINNKKESFEQRKDLKLSLTTRLYDKGFNEQQINNLYKFIDWLIALPRELELQYLHELYCFEEVMKMPYVSSAEKFGMEKGREQEKLESAKNLLKEKKEIAKRMLTEGSDLVFIEKVTKLPLATIKDLQIKLKT